MDYEFNDPGDDLTPEEQEELEKLTEDVEGNLEGYQWDEDFQRYIIGMLLNDRYFATQSLDLVQPKFFADEVHQLLCRALFTHLEKYSFMPPRTFILEAVRDFVAEKDAKVRYHYVAETNVVYERYVPGLEARDFLLDKITNFAKLQALRVAFQKCLWFIKKNPEGDSTWMKIHQTLRDALLVDRNFDAGLNYFETVEERYAKLAEDVAKQEHFTSGFKAIDDALIGGGPHRGEIYSWIGLPGTGKSLALVSAALRNVAELGKRVLYVSLEMDEYKVAERFDAQFANLNIGVLQENVELVKKALEEQVCDKDDKRMLVIKQFPAGSMSVPQLRAYMQQLAMSGFKADLLILDYIGEMKDYPGMKTYESRYRIVRDLRGMAVEEDICIFTAMQPNKDAREAQKKDSTLGSGHIDDTNLADSYGQVRPLDGCWSINQMQAEKECIDEPNAISGIARIFVIKHRHGKSRFEFHVKYDMNTLQMTQISKEKYNEIWRRHQFDKDITEADVDKHVRKPKDKGGIPDSAKGYKFKGEPKLDEDFDPDKPDNDEDGAAGAPVKQ